MKIHRFILIALLFLLIGCVNNVPLRSIVAKKAYLAGYFEEFEHFLLFKNLETGHGRYIKFKASNSPTFNEIPVGRWSVVQIHGFINTLFGRKELRMSIPNDLLTIIEAREGTVTFIGDFAYTHVMSEILLAPFGENTFFWDYPIEEFSYYLKTNDELRIPLKIQALKRLHIH